MKYVLFMFFFNSWNNSSDSSTQEFSSKLACETALADFKKKAHMPKKWRLWCQPYAKTDVDAKKG